MTTMKPCQKCHSTEHLHIEIVDDYLTDTLSAKVICKKCNLSSQRHYVFNGMTDDERPVDQRSYRAMELAELEKRAEEHGIGDDPELAHLLHIIQLKEAVKNGHKRTMKDLDVWEKNIASCVEQRIEEAGVSE